MSTATSFANLSDTFLESKRNITDPLADGVINTIITSGFEEHVNKVFYKLVSNESYSPEYFSDLPREVGDAVINYFNETSDLPDWADEKLINSGQLVFSLYGPEISMLLNVKSLPLCYACGNGAKVLHMTGRLSDHNGDIDPLARRLMETAQMVMNTMTPGGLGKNGNGIVTIQKVRLIHAAIRYFLKNKNFNKEGWDVAQYGEPINQEDMAGTLMSFSALMVKGLEQLSIELTNEQQLGYMHTWRVIGYLMGLEEDLLPHTYNEGWDLGVGIMRHQAANTEEGIELTKSCVNFLKYITPGNLFDNVPEYMIWYFSQDVSEATGKDLASMIGVTNAAGLKGKIILLLSKLLANEVDHLQDHSKNVQKLSGFFNKILLRGFLKHYNGGKNVHFFIPPSLKKNWKLDEEWVDNMAITPSIYGNRLMWQKRQTKL